MELSYFHKNTFYYKHFDILDAWECTKSNQNKRKCEKLQQSYIKQMWISSMITAKYVQILTATHVDYTNMSIHTRIDFIHIIEVRSFLQMHSLLSHYDVYFKIDINERTHSQALKAH